MIFFNKVVFVPNLINLCRLLQNHSNYTLDHCIYNDRIAVKHNIQGDYNVVRMWRTKSLFDYFYDGFTVNRFIAALDYKINDDHIKIEFLNINDDENYNINDLFLNSEESSKLTKSLVDFIKNKAVEENKTKIIIDVHSNLRLYDKYYKNNGFKVTNRKCSDNKYWVETEIILENANK